MRKAIDIYNNTIGEVTVEYYKQLCLIGPIGEVAMNLFRAQKCSDRAKAYRRSSWKTDAYNRKQYSLEQLCEIMEKYGPQLGYSYGWKQDPNIVFGGYYDDAKISWVFYIDLPVGQVSFHSPTRYKKGPDYLGEWDGVKNICQKRVILFCDAITNQTVDNGNQNQIERNQAN